MVGEYLKMMVGDGGTDFLALGIAFLILFVFSCSFFVWLLVLLFFIDFSEA